MFPGETLLSGATTMCCANEVDIEVMSSPAGGYVGSRCGICQMPHTRETHYMPLDEAALVVEAVRKAVYAIPVTPDEHVALMRVMRR
jgi:hypothetical protein